MLTNYRSIILDYRSTITNQSPALRRRYIYIYICIYRERDTYTINVSIDYVCIYIYICMHMYTHTHIYIYSARLEVLPVPGGDARRGPFAVATNPHRKLVVCRWATNLLIVATFAYSAHIFTHFATFSLELCYWELLHSCDDPVCPDPIWKLSKSQTLAASTPD